MDSRGKHSETSDGKHDERERELAQPVAAPDDNQLIGGGPPEAVVREPLMYQPSSSPDPSSPSATYVSGTAPIASSSQPSTAKRRLPEDDGYQQSNKRMRLDSRNVADSLAGPPPAIATMPEVPGQEDQHIWICLIEPGGQLKPRKSVEVDTPRNVSALRDYAFSQMKLSGLSTDLLVFPPGTRVPRNYDEEDNASLKPGYSKWQPSTDENPYLIMAPPPVPTLALSTATQQTMPTEDPIAVALRFNTELQRKDRSTELLVEVPVHGRRSFLNQTLFHRVESLSTFLEAVREFLTAADDPLRSYPLPLMPGSPGVGKTRLLVEIARNWTRLLEDNNIQNSNVTDAVRLVVTYNSGYEEQCDKNDLFIRILFLYLFGFSDHFSLWTEFRTIQALQRLTSTDLISFILQDSGKKSIFIGVDESLSSKDLQDFRKCLTSLIGENRPESHRHVFVAASSLSLSRFNESWLVRNSSGTFANSGRLVIVVPLPAIPLEQVRASPVLQQQLAKLSEDQQRDTTLALELSAGHPRSLASVLFNIAQAAETQQTLPSLSLLVNDMWRAVRQTRTDLSDEVAILAATASNLALNEQVDELSVMDIISSSGLFVTPTQEDVAARSVRIAVVPAVLYHWAFQTTKTNSWPQLDTLSIAKARVDTMFRASLQNSCDGFESFVCAFFSLAWGRRTYETLDRLFPCFSRSDITLQPIASDTVVLQDCLLADAIQLDPHMYIRLKSRDLNGSYTYEFTKPVAIHFAGQGDRAQHGFDVMLYQPSLHGQPAVMVLLECKYSARLSTKQSAGGKEVHDKVRLTAEQLAPFLPDMDNLFEQYHVRDGQLSPYSPVGSTACKPRNPETQLDITSNNIMIVLAAWRLLTNTPDTNPNNYYKAETYVDPPRCTVGIMAARDLGPLFGTMWTLMPMFRALRDMTENVVVKATATTTSTSTTASLKELPHSRE